METETFLIILGLIMSPVYAIQLFMLNRLNFTCGTISKLATLARLAHPELAKKVFGDSNLRSIR